jgi:RNA polymerase sigma-70 factor (ECF subfamily)
MSPAALLLLGSAENVDLLRQLKLRKSEAVAQLYQKYGALLFGLINNVVPDRELAENMLLEVFLLACNRVHDFPDDSINLGVWLLVLARNHVVCYQKCSNNLGQPSLNLEAPVLFQGEAALTGFDQLPQLQEAFLRLPQQSRAALELAWRDGLSYKEISEKLQQPTATAKAMISEGLTRVHNL